MYNHPSQFTPLIPGQAAFDRLVDNASDVVAQSYALTQAAHPSTLDRIRALVRSMNSYYSNLIEGQSTHPANIERALRDDFSADPDIARKQRIALAHIYAEQQMQAHPLAFSHPFSIEIVKACHQAIYDKLEGGDRLAEDNCLVVGGAIRDRDVQVGRHLAPVHGSIEAFLEAWQKQYDRPWSDAQRVVVAALAHHRLAWLHPFVDGNGRAARLQTYLALFPVTQGLWSVNRGLARNLTKENGYYHAMASADTLRQGDYDGRGNLSEKAFVNWAQMFIDTCRDQVAFQRKMLDFDTMKARIEALVFFCQSQSRNIRQEAALPLYHLFAAGPLMRSQFAQMTGLGERSARYLISALLKEGLVTSSAHNAPLAFGLPHKHLHFLLPNLYPEASMANTEDIPRHMESRPS